MPAVPTWAPTEPDGQIVGVWMQPATLPPSTATPMPPGQLPTPTVWQLPLTPYEPEEQSCGDVTHAVEDPSIFSPVLPESHGPMVWQPGWMPMVPPVHSLGRSGLQSWRTEMLQMTSVQEGLSESLQGRFTLQRLLLHT